MTKAPKRINGDPYVVDNWEKLSASQKAIKTRALKVLSLKRNTLHSLSKLAREYNIAIGTIIRYTGAFEKIDGKWEAKGYDSIDRGPKPLYSRGRLTIISPADSTSSSRISAHNTAVKQSFENPDDESLLRDFVGLRVMDRDGNSHKLETNLRKLMAARERTVDQEYPEFYEEYY